MTRLAQLWRVKGDQNDPVTGWLPRTRFLVARHFEEAWRLAPHALRDGWRGVEVNVVHLEMVQPEVFVSDEVLGG